MQSTVSARIQRAILWGLLLFPILVESVGIVELGRSLPQLLLAHWHFVHVDFAKALQARLPHLQ